MSDIEEEKKENLTSRTQSEENLRTMPIVNQTQIWLNMEQ